MTGNVRVNINIESHSRSHFCRRKAVSIIYTECVFVALFIRHAKRMSHIILATVACLSVRYFPYYLIKAKIFEIIK